MGITKTSIYTDAQNDLALLAKAIAHPARIAILQHIIKTQACICGDLVNEIGLAQPTISQHLKELKHAEIIKGSVEGTSICYCINTQKWNQIKTQFSNFFETFKTDNSTNCC
ncbi:metalloregulator ArsR/SmtB family transcription factor [Ascidiimonas sp. W6]|uniref:ArsR/SmtB family transcription factor n=1 Tax=Ascidiimonas meishanensis TaxID=3128903 RepID=UPI0030ED3DC3